MKILPASSGVQELSELTSEQKICLLSELDSLYDETDILLIRAEIRFCYFDFGANYGFAYISG